MAITRPAPASRVRSIRRLTGALIAAALAVPSSALALGTASTDPTSVGPQVVAPTIALAGVADRPSGPPNTSVYKALFVSPDGTTMYGVTQRSTILEFSVGSLTQTDSIATAYIPLIGTLSADRSTGWIVSTNALYGGTQFYLESLDLATGTLGTPVTIDGTGALGLAGAAAITVGTVGSTPTAFVGFQGDGTLAPKLVTVSMGGTPSVSVLNLATAYGFVSDSRFGVALSADGSIVYVGNGAASGVLPLDATAPAAGATPLDVDGRELAVFDDDTADGANKGHLYAVDTSPAQLSVFDLDGSTSIATRTITAPPTWFGFDYVSIDIADDGDAVLMNSLATVEYFDTTTQQLISNDFSATLTAYPMLRGAQFDSQAEYGTCVYAAASGLDKLVAFSVDGADCGPFATRFGALAEIPINGSEQVTYTAPAAGDRAALWETLAVFAGCTKVEVRSPDISGAFMIDWSDVSSDANVRVRAYTAADLTAGGIIDTANITCSTPYVDQVTSTVEFTALQATFVGGGYSVSCADASTGLKCWGDNSYGKLGNGDKSVYQATTPVDVVGVASPTTASATLGLPGTPTAVDSGNGHTCAIVGGTVYCWGNNGNGELGNGDDSVSDSATPIAVAAVTGFSNTAVTALAAGYEHTCAIESGSVYCWGNNGDSQLGDGSSTSSWTPVKVAANAGEGFTNASATSIAAGWYHTCAVAAGKAYCWGLNSDGELGDNTITRRSLPVLVLDNGGQGFTNASVTQVVTSDASTCALVGGSVYCWGYDDSGKLGNGVSGSSRLPVKVLDNAGEGFTNSAVTTIAAGEDHYCAIRAAAAFCWGYNSYGQLGDGTTNDRNVPVAVAAVAGGFTNAAVSAVGLGYWHSCAVDDGGTYCWGTGSYGALGNNTTVDSSSPVPVCCGTAPSPTASVWVSTQFNDKLEIDDYAVGTACGDDTWLAWQESAASALTTASSTVDTGGTIYICDGTYPLDTSFTVLKDGITYEAVSYDSVDLDVTDNAGGDDAQPVIIEPVTSGDGITPIDTQLVAVSEVEEVTFRGIWFRYGSSDGDGGAINAPLSIVNIDACVFTYNEATGNGGAIAARVVNVVEGTGVSEIAAVFGPNVSNSDGSAEAGNGGAIYASESVTITNALLVANTAIGESDGGAIWAPSVTASSSVFIFNNTNVPLDTAFGVSAASISKMPGVMGDVAGDMLSVDTVAALDALLQSDATSRWAATQEARPAVAERAGLGGAIASAADLGAVTVTDSMLLASGGSTFLGGAIATTGAGATVDIDRSTLAFSGIVLESDTPTSWAERGGSVYVADGNVSVTTSSILFSGAIDGGAIAVDSGTVQLDHTGVFYAIAAGLTGNGDGNASAILVGGGAAIAPAGTGSSISNSYFTVQIGATGCSFPVGEKPTDGGNNLQTRDTTCAGELVGDADIAPAVAPWTPLPTLGPLNSFSVALQVAAPSSVAIDAIPASDASCTGTDQWDVTRPVGVGCDIGPWEASVQAEFTADGTFTVPDGVTSIDVLLVGGGGAGSTGGGGGGGGEVLVCSDVPVVSGDVLTITVGAGGASPGDAGSTSGVYDESTTELCAALGGDGGDSVTGGDSGAATTGGTGVASEGLALGGGGGGAGGPGGDAAALAFGNYLAGSGGVGLAVSEGLFGSYPFLLGGGGGGGASWNLGTVAGGRGNAGGGTGASYEAAPTAAGTSGAVNSGGGGGGGATDNAPGAGGSGYALIRHAVPLSGVPTTTTTQVSATSIQYGNTISDTATVSAAVPSSVAKYRYEAADLGIPTGDVEWFYCYSDTTAPTSCDDEVGSYIDTITLGVDGTATLSDWEPADGVGYYLFHAVYLGDGTFLSSADDGTNESFEVTKATGTIVYTGNQYFTAGTATAVLSVTVGPAACRTGSVTFSWDSDGDGDYDTELGTATIDSTSGAASYVWTLPTGASLLDVLVEYPGDSNCTDASTTATIIVAGSGDSSNGGGRYNQNGRVNFGYTVQVKTSRTGVTTVSGQLLWHLNGKVRIKGTISGYTRITCPTQSPSLSGTTCGYIVGTGRLSTWDNDLDEWTYVSGSVSFRVYVADGGSATTCVKKRCSTTLKPDFFRMDVPSLVLEGESTTLQQLNGGNLIVK